MIYLDNSATTQPYAEVTARMAEEERLRFGNASALYRFGMEAETSILDLKQAVAERAGVEESEINAITARWLSGEGKTHSMPNRLHICE